MKLKQLYISNYKNLNEFTLDFSEESFIETLVGKNGSGKSNFIEALLEVFRHIFQYDWRDNRYDIFFSYTLTYEIEGSTQTIEYNSNVNQLIINGRSRATVGQTPLPDYILTYYAGHNSTVSEHLSSFEEKFATNLVRADQTDSRPFIGLNKSYNDILLTVFSLLPDDSIAKTFVFEKLSIDEIYDELRIELERPHYATTARFDVQSTDEEDPSKYWKLAGTTRNMLDELDTHCNAPIAEGVRTEGYLAGSDTYQRYYSIRRIKEHFATNTAHDFFRMLDNFKTLGMLKSVVLNIKLRDNTDVASNVFSDGQFQAIYLYSISEIFKSANSITIMDEPDSFLHPEWQAQCSEQIQSISREAASTNHIITTTHSAVSLISSPQTRIRYFEEHEGSVRTFTLPKRETVRRLCQGVITYTEEEQMLSVLNAIHIENKPVLFTEGSTDPLIIKSAWYKLYPDTEMPFIPFYAFSCSHINQLITDQRIHNEMNGRKVFALFDFDEAYNQWNSLNGRVLLDNVSNGLVKKWDGGEAYAIMLPVPQHPDIQRQVFKNEALEEHFGGASFCMIEHLFYGLDLTAPFFTNQNVPGGQLIQFQGCKTNFAKTVVPTLPPENFEVFRPMLDWIRELCA
ncbi:AAA family ATPase [Vibrio parahaemolyticus]|nr:AAA family ATPase [Vibrio parahaemolyticus]HCG8836645.1 AAA family ATPase [Vibrio parahaemolyticus]